MKRLFLATLLIFISNGALAIHDQNKEIIEEINLTGCYRPISINGMPIGLPTDSHTYSYITYSKSPFFQSTDNVALDSFNMFLFAGEAVNGNITETIYNYEPIFTDLGTFDMADNYFTYRYRGILKTIPNSDFSMGEEDISINQKMVFQFISSDILQITSTSGFDGMKNYQSKNIYLLEKSSECDLESNQSLRAVKKNLKFGTVSL